MSSFPVLSSSHLTPRSSPKQSTAFPAPSTLATSRTSLSVARSSPTRDLSIPPCLRARVQAPQPTVSLAAGTKSPRRDPAKTRLQRRKRMAISGWWRRRRRARARDRSLLALTVREVLKMLTINLARWLRIRSCECGLDGENEGEDTNEAKRSVRLEVLLAVMCTTNTIWRMLL